MFEGRFVRVTKTRGALFRVKVYEGGRLRWGARYFPLDQVHEVRLADRTAAYQTEATKNEERERAAARRRFRDRAVAKGWRKCPRCKGKGCRACRRTGIELKSVQRPKFNAREAKNLGGFRPQEVKDLLAEMIVWEARKEAPSWILSDAKRFRILRRSHTLAFRWRSLIKLELTRRGWGRGANGWSGDLLKAGSQKEIDRLRALYQWVDDDPERLAQLDPKEVNRSRLLTSIKRNLPNRRAQERLNH